MVTAMWTSVIIKEPDNYGGRELFFFCLSTIKWVENSQQRKKRKKKKKDSQTVGYWCVVFTSIRRSERTFLGTTVIFLKKLQMCLQMKNTLFHSSSPKEVALTLLAHKWKGPTRSSVADESILTNRQNSSHLFLQKSLSFIFTLSTVISWFSLLGKAFRLLWQPYISSPKGTSPLPKPYFSLESHATSSPVSLLGVL